MIRVDDLAGMQVFERIVALGSLTAAASELGLSLAVVSKRLAAFERRLGMRLLHRNTRRLALTDEGKLLYGHAVRVVTELEQAGETLARQRKEISGLLKLTAPSSFGRRRLIPLLAEFHALHPELRIQLHLSDDVQDLITGGFDLAIRYGVMRDTGFKVRELAQNRRILCAAPAYLRRRGTPQRLSDLRNHDCILIGVSPTAEWRFGDNRRTRPVQITGHAMCNDGEAALAMALQGMGIVFKSIWDVIDDIRSERLIQVLPRHALAAAPLNILCLPGQDDVPRMKAFITFMEDRITSS